MLYIVRIYINWRKVVMDRVNTRKMIKYDKTNNFISVFGYPIDPSRFVESNAQKVFFFSGPTFSRITTNLPSRLWLVFFLLFFLFFFNKLQCSPLCPNKWPKMIKKNVSKAFNTTLINCFLWILEMDLRRQKKKN